MLHNPREWFAKKLNDTHAPQNQDEGNPLPIAVAYRACQIMAFMVGALFFAGAIMLFFSAGRVVTGSYELLMLAQLGIVFGGSIIAGLASIATFWATTQLIKKPFSCLPSEFKDAPLNYDSWKFKVLATLLSVGCLLTVPGGEYLAAKFITSDPSSFPFIGMCISALATAVTLFSTCYYWMARSGTAGVSVLGTQSLAQNMGSSSGSLLTLSTPNNLGAPLLSSTTSAAASAPVVNLETKISTPSGSKASSKGYGTFIEGSGRDIELRSFPVDTDSADTAALN